MEGLSEAAQGHFTKAEKTCPALFKRAHPSPAIRTCLSEEPNETTELIAVQSEVTYSIMGENTYDL